MNLKILFVAMALPMTSLAQPQSHHSPKWMQGLDSSIALSAEQKQKMEDIHLSYRDKLVEERKNHNENMKSLRQAERAEMMAVLSPEQQAKLKEEAKNKKKEVREMQRELNQYRKNNITPVLTSYRQQLEQKLNFDEKEAIGKARAMQSDFKEKRKTDAEAKMSPEDRKAMQNLLKPVLENHQDFMKNMQEELKTKQEVWEKDLQAIHEKHGQTMKKAPKKRKLEAQLRAMQFLLMNP